MFILEVGRGCPDDRWPLYGIFEFDQAVCLRDHGHRVLYAALDVRSIRRKRRFGLYRKDKDGVPVYVFSFPVGALRGPDIALASRGFKRLLKKIIREEGRPDVIHAHFFDVAAAAGETAQEFGIPLVVTEHSSKTNRDVMDEKELSIQKKGYGAARKVIAVSTALAKSILRNTGVEACVIPDVLRFPEIALSRVYDGRDGLSFISAANLLPNKGFDVLIEAFDSVSETLPDARLTIMGDGPERQRIERMISERGLSDRVSMTGRYTREMFAEALSKSDVFVLPSRSETFGVVYAEALSSGVPVIATRCGGPEDIVNGENGILVDVDDAGALSEAMKTMAAHLGDYDRESIAKDCRKRYSAETVAEQVTRTLEAAVEEGN